MRKEAIKFKDLVVSFLFFNIILIEVTGVSLKTSDELKQLYGTLGSAFKEDTNNINNGYPILSWQ